MSEDLIEFWRRCKLDRGPFVHPDDLETLRQQKGRWVEDDPISFDSYVAHRRFGKLDDDRFHLSLLPVPYAGDIRNAKIVILLLNPGFNHCDYWAEYNMPNFREQLKSNVVQEFSGVEFPFSGLDPQFCWYSGYMWWEKKLRDVIQKIVLHKKISYRDALRDLSGKLACLELVPYHSTQFGDHRVIKQLASTARAKAFVHECLIPEAEAGKRTLIVTRQAENWGLRKSKSVNVIVYEGGHTRGASLSPQSTGGRAILRHYGIFEP